MTNNTTSKEEQVQELFTELVHEIQLNVEHHKTRVEILKKISELNKNINKLKEDLSAIDRRHPQHIISGVDTTIEKIKDLAKQTITNEQQ